MNRHATAIEWNNTGILFVGSPGCGKSSLALDLIEQGATLIADDQIFLDQRDGDWYAICPESIRNKLHIRDVGLLHINAKPKMKIDMIFQSIGTTEALSKAPSLGLPVVEMDFKVADVKESIVKILRSFDLVPAFP